MDSVKATQLASAAEILQNTETSIEKVLTDEQNGAIRSRVLGDLSNLRKFVGNHIPENQGGESRRVKRFLGKVINKDKLKKLQPIPAHTQTIKEISQQRSEEANQVAQSELQTKVDTIYPLFKDMSVEEILDNYNELEIRAVGKKAGLPVTEISPKKVDVKFIKQIKTAIEKKAELDELKAQSGQVGGGADVIVSITPEQAAETVAGMYDMIGEEMIGRDDLELKVSKELWNAYGQHVAQNMPEEGRADFKEALANGTAELRYANATLSVVENEGRNELIEAFYLAKENHDEAVKEEAHHMKIKSLRKKMEEAAEAAGFILDENGEVIEDFESGNPGSGE